MESFICGAGEIQGDPRRWVEACLGQHLQQNQRVMVTVLNVGIEPDEKTRREASEALRQIRAKAAANVEGSGRTADALDGVVDEVIAELRRHK